MSISSTRKNSFNATDTPGGNVEIANSASMYIDSSRRSKWFCDHRFGVLPHISAFEMQPTCGRQTELRREYDQPCRVMRKLRQKIKQELRTAKHCAVYNEELLRVWPQNGERRET